MKKHEAANLMMSMLKQHGLSDWQFYFDRGKRRLGCCNNYRRTISLSREFVELNSEEEVKMTIIHEIAHALCPIGEKHGKLWKRKYIELGGTGKRCHEAANLVMRPPKYKGTCPSCGKEIVAHRRTRIACSRCCTQHNFGKFDVRFMFNWSLNRDSIGMRG